MSGAGDPPSIGVVGGTSAVARAVATAGGKPHDAPAADVVAADPDAVVAVGEAALLETVRAGASVPTLAVDAGRALRSTPANELSHAIERLLVGGFDTVEYPVLEVSSSLGTARALLDVMLVTAEQARISEYRVWTGDDRVATFRADGVVVATPAGSQGYARSCDGPVVNPGTGVAAVVPVSPFATDRDAWVLPQDAVELAVERDETPVELLADDRTVGTVDPGRSVRLAPCDTLQVAVVPESLPFFG